MTKEKLRKATAEANRDLRSLSPPPKEPMSEQEIRRREMILLRQVTVYKIADAKEEDDKEAESFHTQMYELITSFLKTNWLS